MTTTVKSRAQFDVEIEALHLRGQWKFDEAVQAISHGPPASGIPFLWKWSDVHEVLLEACDVMPDSLTQRRNVSFINPALRTPNATSTLAAGVQLVTPGEIAWGHRHTMGAIRFGIEGDAGLYTVVDGDVLPLEPNDLVLTPSWTWHDHHNDGRTNGAWLDVLDVPLLLAIDQAKYEPYGESVQPRHGRLENVPRRYAWRDVEPLVRNAGTAAGDPYDDVVFEYVNPATGGPTLPTLGCFVQVLRAGFAGATHRHTSAAIYHVVEGAGVTVCGDVELHWSAHDSFVVPSSLPHRHRNASGTDAILFSATDEPMLAAIGLYREDPPNPGRSRIAVVPREYRESVR